ncbi:MAG: cell division protein FtsQ/DivIB [Sciscionella sp.]
MNTELRRTSGPAGEAGQRGSAERGRSDRAADERVSARDRARQSAASPSKRRVLLRRWVALGVVLALLAGAYAVLFTSLFGVRTVEVTGLRRLTVEQVRAVANVEPGSAMLRLDTDAIAANVEQLPVVASVDVERSFPSTLTIHVHERVPVAVFYSDDGLRLVDATGTPLRVVAKEPNGLPRLNLPEVSANDARTRAALNVLTALPSSLARHVTAVGARSPGDVRLVLASGRIVKWGDASDSDRKAKVLAVLLTRKGTVFDVASPGAPAVR